MSMNVLPDWMLSRIEVAANGCWMWTGHKSSAGYGQLPRAIGSRKAHRYAYEVLVGSIPQRMTIDHLCRCTSCVNPAHMELTSRSENTRRASHLPDRNGAKTHCIHGHALIAGNLVPNRRGKRVCRECHRRDDRAFALKKKGEPA